MTKLQSSVSCKIAASSSVAGVRPYCAPKPSPQVGLRLDSNEGIAPAADLIDALREAGRGVFRSYPSASELEKLLAERLKVEPGQVLVTAGADEALDRICRALLGPGRELILPVPTFEMLERYAQLAGTRVVSVPWPAGEYPRAEVLAAVTRKTAAIAVVSPNNPTGAVATASDLQELSTAVPHAVVTLDAAYTEFAEEDLTPVGLRLPNAIVVRSLSKAWGLAGLRVGYAVGPRRLIDWLRVAGSPYSVCGPALVLAAAWLEQGPAKIHQFVTRVQAERVELSRLLRELGGEPLPSQANFVLVRLSDSGSVYEGLTELGIAVRAFAGRPELDGCLRITCPGDDDTFARLTKALWIVLSGGGRRDLTEAMSVQTKTSAAGMGDDPSSGEELQP